MRSDMNSLSKTPVKIPDRWLVIGPDRAGNLLEVVVLVSGDTQLAIHAMAMRPQYRRLLDG